MLKNILKINGIKELNKTAQKSMLGGFGPGFCYMQGPSTCCCHFADTDRLVCGDGRPTGASQIGCQFGG